MTDADAMNPVHIHGHWGEGGGQVLRTALTLSVALRRPFAMNHIRGNRSKPGLRPQHLTAVRMMAELASADVKGDRLGSTNLKFTPTERAGSAELRWDVAGQSKGGSAGSVMLLIQTLLPAALPGTTFRLRGGTHVPWSPAYHYVEWVHLPLLSCLGWDVELNLQGHGFYPRGEGCVAGGIRRTCTRPLDLRRRGQVQEITGLSVAAHLPEHVARRQARAATDCLRDGGLDARVEWKQVDAACPGTAIVLVARSEHSVGGTSALGKKGFPAEEVGRGAARALLAYLASDTALDLHQGDQMLVPAVLCPGESVFAVERITSHLVTNARVVNAFASGCVQVDGEPGRPGTVWVKGIGH